MPLIKTILLLSVAYGLCSCVTVPNQDGLLAPTQGTLSKNKKIGDAEAKITITSTRTNSNQIELNVRHIGALNKINPRAKNYIVWELPAGTSMKPQSLGPLYIDKTSQGKLKTVTPFRNFDIFITAESAPNPAQPTGEKLFWTTINR